MGVPLFAYYIKQRVSDAFIITSLNSNYLINNIDYLYIDGNAIVHPAAAKITATGIYKQNEYKKNWNPPNYKIKRKLLPYNATYKDIEMCIFKEVCNVIVAAMKISRPKKGVYIIFDGPPPLAKQQQQRERRWKKSVESRKSRNPLEEKWDSCVISPGTIFMDRLFRYLCYWARQRNEEIFFGLQIVIDGSDIPGEGEHKIMDYIRKDNNNSSHIVYGLDADIFMLTLGLLKPNIYLLREDLNNKGTDPFYSNGPSEDAIWYIVNTLKIHKWWKKETRILTRSLSPINDFVFLTFFVGNDFIPPLPLCQNLVGGLILVTTNYKKMLADTTSPITNSKGLINIKVLLYFIKKLAIIEERKCYENSLFEKRRSSTMIEDPKRNKSRELIDTDLIGCFEPKEKVTNKFINGATKKYKRIWYKRAGINNKKELREVCYHYIYTLIWIYSYYKGNLLDWRYYYRYGYAPFPSDIIKYIKEEKIVLDNIFKKGDSLTPIQQLMCIAPKTSLNLLPKEFRKPLKSLPGHYCKKEDVVIDMKGKGATYQAIIHLPFLQVEEIIEIYHQNKEKDYKRDIFGKSKRFVWNPDNRERYKCVFGIVKKCYFTEIKIKIKI